MKKILIVSFLALGITQAASVFIPKLKQSKQETPEVILENYKAHQYSSEITSFCPRDLQNVSYSSSSVYSEDSVENFKHCEKCRIGVYAHHKNDEDRSCTFCGSKE